MIRTPEPDTYGRHARPSLLADYVELLALSGRPVRMATVADFLADNDWNMELIQSAHTEDTHEELNALPEQLDAAHEDAGIVFRQIYERRDLLRDRYPFEIVDDIVSLGRNVAVEASTYVAVLALTIGHAFDVTLLHSPNEMFEDLVTRALQDRGFSSTGLAAHRRTCGSFEAALRNACDEVGLAAAPNAAPRLIRAHDEGVDVLGHIGWDNDLRPGTWAFIGQATVGKSDTWDEKIREPKPEPWKMRLGTWVPPAAFLAVPHHVERRMMERLTTDSQAVVLDRLRLARYKSTNDTREQEVIRTVLQEEVEPLAG